MRFIFKTFIFFVLFVIVLLLVAKTILGFSIVPLEMADSYSILASTYSNTAIGTTVSGDVGYTTPPAVVPSITGVVHVADDPYTKAGIAQGNALALLNSQPCDYNFPSPTDLSLLSQPLTHGVYCMVGDSSVGTGGVILGEGFFLFRIDGALNTVANSKVSMLSGSSDCDVFWTPTKATTLGANSQFLGTVIDASGITVGSTVNWSGRALAFGGTVTTDADTIVTPTCSGTYPVATTTPPAAPGLPDVGSSTPGYPNGYPALPKTGYPPREESPWGLIVVGIVLLALPLTLLWPKKK